MKQTIFTKSILKKIESSLQNPKSRNIETLSINNKTIYKIDIPLSLNNLHYIDLLNQYNTNIKFFWCNKTNTKKIIAFGNKMVYSFEELKEYLKEGTHTKNTFYFLGGMAFHRKPYISWPFSTKRKLPYSAFILPEWMILLEKNKYILQVYFTSDEKDSVIQNLEKIEKNKKQASTTTSSMVVDINCKPKYKKWKNQMKKCKKIFQTTALKKLVLSRQVTLTYSQPHNGLDILKALEKEKANSYMFYFQWNFKTYFLGLSPETLYQKKGSICSVEAIAGTTMRGKNTQDDKKNAKELISSIKNQSEHIIVSDFLLQQMDSICYEHKLEKQQSILKLKYLQHIYSKIKGFIRPNITDIDILEKLHPTPAVAGFPKELAQKYIQKIEKYSREWYAAPIGYISKESVFCVAIRSLLIYKSKGYIYSGAGIVPQSTPLEEWEELNQKTLNYIDPNSPLYQPLKVKP